MGDPVTMAIIGGSVGAMSNSKDPLKGALLGAAGGYGGATLMGAGGLAGAGSSGVLPSALSGSTTINAAAPMAGQAFAPASSSVLSAATQGPTSLANTNLLNEASKFASPEGFGGTKGMFSGGIGSSIYTPANLGGGPTTGMIPSSLYEPTMMDKFASVGQYAQQNPVLTQMAMQSAQQAMQQPEAQFAPAGQVRSGEIKSNDYSSLLNPQQDTVLRPQRISLLG
jgi:hypothetical protein